MDSVYGVPRLLQAAFFSHIWGGTLLREQLGKDIPDEHTGEAWEVSALAEGQCGVVMDAGKTMPFAEYAAGPDFYGARVWESFPLLIKFIGAAQPLSVQVHPSDAAALPGEAGKTEAWYIIHAQPGARLVYGIDCSAAEFADMVTEGRTRDCLHWVDVRPGDVLYVRPGQIHAIGEGIVLYEVQQSSNTTFRVYDWDRVDPATGRGRQLHVRRALEVSDPSLPNEVAPGFAVAQENAVKTVYLHNCFFTLERLEIRGDYHDDSFGGFALYSVIDGMGMVGGDAPFMVSKGQSFVVPAAAGPLHFCGIATLLKSHLPDDAAYQSWLTAQGGVLRGGVAAAR